MNKILTNNIRSVGSLNQQNVNSMKLNPQTSFAQVLEILTTSKEIKFSKHAVQRLESRNIQLTKNEMGRIETGLKKASQKGIRETLILMDNKAFVASVQNRTIITAALDEQLKDNVFTNIDGAVIV